MKRFLTSSFVLTAMAAFILLSANAASFGDILVNPGFETGTDEGWTIGPELDSFVPTTDDAHSGEWSAVTANRAETDGAGISQQFTPLSTVFEISFWIKAPAPEYRSFLRFDNAGVDETFSYFFTLQTTDWTQVDLTAFVQAKLAESADRKLQGVNFFTGPGGGRVFLDDFVVSSVPEPSTIALWPVAGLIGAWRRRKRA